MGGAFSFAQGGPRPGGTRPRPPFLFAMATPRAHLGTPGGLPLPWAGLFFPLRSCARGAEDGVCCLLYVAFLDTTELTVCFAIRALLVAIVGLLR